MKKNKSKRMTEEDLKKILKNKNLKVTVNGNQNKTFKDMIIEDNEKKVSSSTENIRVKIISSLQNCDITIDGSNEPEKSLYLYGLMGQEL